MRMLTCLLLLTSLLIPARGQVAAVSPNQSVLAVAGNMMNTGESMAIDVAGNAYLMSLPSALYAGTISKVEPDGTVHETFHNLGPWNQAGQLCTNPADGQVYFPWNPSPVIGGSGTSIWRIDPVVGAVLHFTTDVSARGLAIDDGGSFYLGGFSNLGGQGVRVVSPPIVIGSLNTSTQVTSGFGASHRLLSMADGSLLIGDGLTVQRFQPPASATGQPFFSYAATPGSTATLTSLARSSINESGMGALIGVRETMNPPNFTGIGYGFLVKPAGGSPVVALQEPFITNGFVGTYGPRCLATRANEEILWYSHNTSSMGLPHSLHRIRQIPSANATGSLVVTVTPGQLALAVPGNAPGGHPVQVSVTVGHVALPGAYLPYGVLELNPLHPSVTPLVNGLGLGGVSDGSLIPNSGIFSIGIPLPLGLPASLPITLEGIILDSAAPNGLFYETNVVWTALP